MAAGQPDLVYYSTIDDSEALKALDRIDAKAKALADKLAKHFDRVGGSLSNAFTINTKSLDVLQNKLSALNIDGLLAQLDQIQGRVNQITTTAEPTTTGAGPQKVISTNVSPAIDSQDQALKNLIATELVAIATGDKLAQDFIKQASSGNTTSQEFLDIINVTGLLSKEQVDLAQKVGGAKTSINQLRDSLDDSSSEYQNTLELIRQQQEALEGYEAALQQAAEQSTTRAQKIRASEIAIVQALNTKKQAEQQALQTERQRNAEIERGKQLLITNINSVKGVRDAVAKLAAQEGQLTLKLGAQENELTQNDKKLLKILNSNKQLAAVLRNVEGQLGRTNIKFNSLNFPIKKIDETRRKTIQLGEALKFKLISLFETGIRKGVEFFRTLSNEASRTAEEFKITQLAFEQILGDPQAALATFNLVRKESERTGTDITSLIAQILPQLPDPSEQIPKVAEIARGLLLRPLAVLQNKTIEDVSIALSEILSGGQAQSLRFRFNVPFETTRKVTELARTEGLDAALNEIVKYLEKVGTAGEALQDTLTQNRNEARAFFTTLKAELGAPLNDQLLEFWNTLAEFLRDNRDQLLELAYVAGDLFGTLVEFAKENIFSNLTPEVITDFTASLRDLIDGITRLQELSKQVDFNFPSLNLAKNFTEGILSSLESVIKVAARAIDTLGRIFGLDLGLEDKITDAFDNLGEYVDKTFDAFGGLNKVLQTAQQFIALLNVPIAGVAGGLAGLIASVKNLGGLIGDDLTWDQYKEKIQDAIDFAIEPYNKKILETAKNIEEQNNAIKANNEVLDENIKKRRDARNIDEPIIAAASATTGPSEDELSAAEDVLRKRLEIEKKYIEKELDLEIETQRKRVEIWDNYYQKLEESARQLLEDIADADLDYARKQEDLATDIANDQEDIERESAKKRGDIEKDYLRKLEDLRRKFQFDAQEAIRANDAIRFLQLRRQLEFDKRTAEIEKSRALEDQQETEDEKLEDLRIQEERKRQQLQVEYERELEDARIKDGRRRHDAWLAKERELEDLLKWEAEKRADLQLEYQREIEEFGVFQQEKQEGTAAALAELQRLVEEGNQQLADTESDFYRMRIAEFERFVADYQRTAAGLQTLQNIAGVNGDNIDPANGPVNTANTLIQRLRLQAERIARAKNLLTDQLMRQIAEADTITLLQRIINDLLQQPSAPPPTGRAYGGSIQPNRAYMVGELGPELLLTGNFGGRVIPMMGNNYGLNLPMTGSNTTNNNFNNNFSMLDPTTFSPAQIAIMQNIFNAMMMGVVQKL